MPALTNQQLVDVYTVINSKYDQIAALAGDRTSITPADLKLAQDSKSLSTAEKENLKPFSNQVANSPGYWKSVANTKWHPTPNALSKPEVVSLLGAAQKLAKPTSTGKKNAVTKPVVPQVVILNFKTAASALKALDSKIVAALAKGDIRRVNELVKGYQGLLTSAVRAYDNAMRTGASAPAIAQAFGEPASLTRDSLLRFWHGRMAATVGNAVEITINRHLTTANVNSHRANPNAGKDWLATVDASLVNIAALGKSLEGANDPSKTKVTEALTNLNVKLQEHFGAIFAHVFRNSRPNANEAEFLGSVFYKHFPYQYGARDAFSKLWDISNQWEQNGDKMIPMTKPYGYRDRKFLNMPGTVTFGFFKNIDKKAGVNQRQGTDGLVNDRAILWLYSYPMKTVEYLPRINNLQFSLNGNT